MKYDSSKWVQLPRADPSILNCSDEVANAILKNARFRITGRIIDKNLIIRQEEEQ